MNKRKFGGDDAALGARIFLLEEFCFSGPALAADGGKGFDGHREKRKGGYQRGDANSHPEKPVVKEDAGPIEEKSVLLDDGPVARDVVSEQEADGIEDAAPEMFEAARGAENSNADDVRHKKRDALKVDHDDFAAESCDAEKDRAEKENLRDDEVKKWLEVPPDVAADESTVVGPRYRR